MLGIRSHQAMSWNMQWQQFRRAELPYWLADISWVKKSGQEHLNIEVRTFPDGDLHLI